MALIFENVQSVRRAPAGVTCPQCKQTIERETQCKKATAMEPSKVNDVYMHTDCYLSWCDYDRLAKALFPQSEPAWLCEMNEIFNVWLASSHAKVYERIFGKREAMIAPAVSYTAIVASEDIKKGSAIGIYRPKEAGWVRLGDKWLAPDGLVVQHANDIPFVCTGVAGVQ